MKHLYKNKLNIQEMNISEMRITNGGILGVVFSKIKVTPKGVTTGIDYAYKAYNIYTQVQTANNIPRPSFTPILVAQVTK